jgi:hypothetical protein
MLLALEEITLLQAYTLNLATRKRQKTDNQSKLLMTAP